MSTFDLKSTETSQKRCFLSSRNVDKKQTKLWHLVLCKGAFYLISSLNQFVGFIRFVEFVDLRFFSEFSMFVFCSFASMALRQPEGSPSTTDYSDGDESEGRVKSWWNWITLNSTAKLVACLFGVYTIHILSVYHAFRVQKITFFFFSVSLRFFRQEVMILPILQRFGGVWHWLGHCLFERWGWIMVSRPAHFRNNCDLKWGTQVFRQMDSRFAGRLQADWWVKVQHPGWRTKTW